MPRAITTLAALALLASLLATEPVAADDAPFKQVYAEHSRYICHLPRSGNAQRVTGFDAGHSFVLNRNGTKTAFWGVGDTFVDGSGDGMYNAGDEPLGFRTGTIGRVTDLTAENCVDIELRTTTGKNELTIFPPSEALGECLMWPNAPFEANGRLFFFYGTVGFPNCNPGLAPTYGIALGEITDVNSNRLAPVRIGSGYKYRGAVKATGRIYMYLIADNNLFLARVQEERVTNRDRYEYWDGEFFTPDEQAAAPLTTGWGGDMPTVAYNEHIGRYLAVYSCVSDPTDPERVFDQLCARTAKLAGSTQNALFSGWNDATVIYRCANLTCGHGAWHPGYTDPAHPERIYVSTAHWPGRQYFVALRSVDLGDAPPPATHVYAEAEHDFFEPPTTHDWTYVSYLPGAAMTELAPPAALSPPDAGGTRLLAAVGTESVSGYAAPGITSNTLYPSETRGAGRVWTAPRAGTARISGEAWIESTRGDGAIAEVLLVKTDGSIVKLWRKGLVAKWTKSRGRRVVNVGIRLNSGDKILVGVRKGRTPSNTATADQTFFPVSVDFDAA